MRSMLFCVLLATFAQEGPASTSRILVAKHKKTGPNYVTVDIAHTQCSDVIFLEKIHENPVVVEEPYIDETGEARVRWKKTGEIRRRGEIRIFVNLKTGAAPFGVDYVELLWDEKPIVRGRAKLAMTFPKSADVPKPGEWINCRCAFAHHRFLGARNRLVVRVGSTDVILEGKAWTELRKMANAITVKLDPDR